MHQIDWSCRICLADPSDVAPPTLPTDYVAAQVQALETAPGLSSITLDEIHQAQAADNSLQLVKQLLKDQTKPPHSNLHQYPEDTRILLS